jgi:hypothetical protein
MSRDLFYKMCQPKGDLINYFSEAADFEMSFFGWLNLAVVKVFESLK